MRIGILTLYAPCNFGANLQAYSSSNYFSKLGNEVYVINYLRKADNDEYRNKVSKEQFSAHRNFITAKLNTTEPITTKNELILLVKKYRFDLIVVGSDAVWRSPQDKDLIYFLDWLFSDSELSGIAAASMSAAHMGNGFQTVDIRNRTIIKNSLNKFCYLSVRDLWTKKVLERDIFKEVRNDIIINPDPVFLIDQFIKDEWYAVENIKRQKYFLMTLPKDWIKSPKHCKHRLYWFQSFKEIVNNAGCCLVELPLPEGVSGVQFDYTIPYPIDPIQWYLWIKNAKAFCGLRFHAIVSSIAGGTPFYSIDSYGSSALPVLIMSRLGLYRLARLFDFKSKIRNLLKDSPFEFCRISRNIESISPKHLFSILVKISSQEVLEFRDKNISLFKRNMQILLEKASSK